MLKNSQILSKIKKAKNIAIFTHMMPDFDALGSSFALKRLCEKLGKNTVIFSDSFSKDEVNANLFPLNEIESDFDAKQFDLIFLTDISFVSRLDKKYVEAVQNFKNVIILDHHILTEETCFPAKIEIVASASQIMLELFKDADLPIDKDVASYIYTGVLGDTSRFLNSNVTKREFDDASFLVEHGVDLQKIYNFMYKFTTKTQIAVNKFIYESMKFLENEKIVYVVVTNKDMKKLNATLEDIKSFSNKLITIKGVEVSFLIYEVSGGGFKFSIRSKSLDILPFVTKYGGGGHKVAAGFDLNVKEKAISKVMKDFVKELLK